MKVVYLSARIYYAEHCPSFNAVTEENAVGEKAVGDVSLKPIKESSNEKEEEDDDEGNWEDEDEDKEGIAMMKSFSFIAELFWNSSQKMETAWNALDSVLMNSDG